MFCSLCQSKIEVVGDILHAGTKYSHSVVDSFELTTSLLGLLLRHHIIFQFLWDGANMSLVFLYFSFQILLCLEILICFECMTLRITGWKCQTKPISFKPLISVGFFYKDDWFETWFWKMWASDLWPATSDLAWL